MTKPREVFINMNLYDAEVAPWRDEPTPYLKYRVCTTINFSPKHSVLFREVLTPDPRDQAIELARENMAKIIENMKPSEGDCMTCDNWPDRKQHHEECPYSNLVDTLTAMDNLLKGQK